MRVAFLRHQFDGTLAYSFLTVAAHKLTGIQKEL